MISAQGSEQQAVSGRIARLLHRAAPFLAAGLFLLALQLLHHELASYRWEEIRHSFGLISPLQVLLAGVLTVTSYTVLLGYDFLAVHYIGRTLPRRHVALASYLGFVLSHNIGTLLGATAPRYRVYTAAGLTPVEVARLFAFTSVSFWVGWLLMEGATLSLAPGAAPLPLSPAAMRVVGGAFLTLVVAYVVATAIRRRPLEIGSLRIALPSGRIAFMQIGVAVADWVGTSMILWVLLPHPSALSYASFLAVYLTAVMAGVLSYIPGGLGVLDSVLVVGLSHDVPAAAVLSALVVFRVIYYLVPLVFAGGLFAGYEGLVRGHWLRAPGEFYSRWVSGMVPRFLALSTFAGGVVLLISGATPPGHGGISILRELLPLPVLELSHFLGSLVGLGLLLLSGALQRRLDAAYHLAVALLGCGVVLSLLRAFHMGEAILLGLMLAALLPCRRHFYRQSALLREPLTRGWAVAVAVTVAGIIAVGMFAHRHVEYSNDLWWEFAVHGDAPRFLRASMGVVIGAVAFGVLRLLRPARPVVLAPSTHIVEQVRAIVEESPRYSARLAFLGDKSFLLSETKRGFVMYGVSGRSWVSMGDPVGPEEEQRELVWRFCEECDRYAAWPVFYEVGPAQLPVYLDVGLAPLKIGEEARVPLETFSLQGPAAREFRNVMSRARREGATFEIAPARQVSDLIPELRAVSDAWLREKNTREKSFSLGYFQPEYLQNFPMAIVRRKGSIVAFADVWLGAEKHELSPDLMRYGPEAPYAAMDYLFLELMLWGKSEGYRWFSLGGAPLSGLRDHPLSPLWHRVGTFVFRYGEHFYNFQGLRAYKNKFHPVWTPLYLVSPGGFALPRILSNVAALVSHGRAW